MIIFFTNNLVFNNSVTLFLYFSVQIFFRWLWLTFRLVVS
jgi:hypothetical protein